MDFATSSEIIRDGSATWPKYAPHSFTFSRKGTNALMGSIGPKLLLSREISAQESRVSNPSRRGALKLTAGMALTGAFALTGCGRGDETAAAKATSAPVDDSPATGTVTVWAAQGDADVLDKVIKPFKAANPDATVKITLIPNGEYYTKLQSAVAAGKGPISPSSSPSRSRSSSTRRS